ncbi:dTDP-4-amino-4,6-dideoxygalactose transaminase [Algoriphagus jejuensis]|uniref:dTDP-4-amino-4,6-dideoxygalactose transaminase n=1 Tax=Algoriphagus jejuensis TaxID=419934 RepID=A0ABP3YJS1_9BACT
MTIPFNKPFLSGNELDYIRDAIQRGKISGNGHYTQKCQAFFEQRYGFQKCLLTSSCTDALEMAAILLDIQPGDEVILPSFTFVSTANAFVLRGAKIVFVDSKAEHPNLDESLLEELITDKTRAIVVVHYGGIACEMDSIMALAAKHHLVVIEDAAQAIDQDYRGKPLGSIGHLGAFSFHETKNIQCGEGGMLAINDPGLIHRAEIIWEKGTDRAAFFRGEVDKYSWVDIGSSFLPSELNAAYLWAQLENLGRIQARRKAIWLDYYTYFSSGEQKPSLLNSRYLGYFAEAKQGLERAAFSFSQASDLGNAHLFYLLFADHSRRTDFAARLKQSGILAVFHYQSLHRSAMAKKYFPEQYLRNLPHADRFSDCLLRLPMFYELPDITATLG